MDYSSLPKTPDLPTQSGGSGDGLPRYVIARGDRAMVIYTPDDQRLSELNVTPLAARMGWLTEDDTQARRSPNYSNGARMQVQVLCDVDGALCVLHANGYAASDLLKVLESLDDGTGRPMYTYCARIGSGDARPAGSRGSTYYPPILLDYEDADEETVLRLAAELRTGNPAAWVNAWKKPHAWTKR